MNNGYLRELSHTAKQKLKNECDISMLEFNRFELINSFLIHKSIEKSRNIHIRTSAKKENENFYIPAVISVVIFGFAKNYIAYNPQPIVGEILQEKRKRYTVVRVGDLSSATGITIRNRADAELRYISLSSYQKYIITTAEKETDGRKLSRGFEHYRSLFNSMFKIGVDKLPSKFEHKYLIVASKDLLKALKKYEAQGINIYKSLPIQYITSGGIATDNLPIDPMIYVVSDYETAKEYLLKRQKIDTIVVVGDSKYRDYSRLIAQDIRASRVTNAIFIGQDSIDNFESLPVWRWTKSEQATLSNYQYNTPEIHIVEQTVLSKSIRAFEQGVKSLEDRYNISLFDEFKDHINRASRVVIPNFGSRLINLLQIMKEDFARLAKEVLEETLYEKDIYDYNEDVGYITSLFNEIVDAVKFEKWRLFTSIKDIQYLVVDKTHYEEIAYTLQLLRSKIKVIQYNALNSIKGDNPKVCFMSIYGMRHFNDCYESDSFQPIFILYPHEVEYYDSLEARYKNNIISELSSPDRYKLTGIQYTAEPYIESVEEMIQRLFDSSARVSNYEQRNIDNLDTQIKANIEFEDGGSELMDVSKSVLLCNGSKTRVVTVDKLQSGDVVRIYSNANKEHLWQIAIESDSEGRFQEINKASIMWKQALSKYRETHNLTLEELFDRLRQNGLTSVNVYQSISRWVDADSDTKFPSTNRSLSVIKKMVNDPMFDANYLHIREMKRSYRGIMISLGRDLSDEIIAYIQSGGSEVGEILNKFEPTVRDSFAQNNAPIRRITNITYVQDGEDE